MCGIVGIVERDLTRPVAEIDVQRMVRTLNHRGPDDEGSVLLPGVGLAMRRLAIVDIAGGQQPFANEDGSLQLVANGEIYNFQEVKRELVARGHQFRSQSDVEVLVHAYEEYGESFLQRIRGMFALRSGTTGAVCCWRRATVREKSPFTTRSRAMGCGWRPRSKRCYREPRWNERWTSKRSISFSPTNT
jgi:glutamine phosphoribosylpyrophosphate amidotransferase